MVAFGSLKTHENGKCTLYAIEILKSILFQELQPVAILLPVKEVTIFLDGEGVEFLTSRRGYDSFIAL